MAHVIKKKVISTTFSLKVKELAQLTVTGIILETDYYRSFDRFTGKVIGHFLNQSVK